MQKQTLHCVELSGRFLQGIALRSQIAAAGTRLVIWGLILNTRSNILLGNLQKPVNIWGVNWQIWIMPKLLDIQIVIKVQKIPKVRTLKMKIWQDVINYTVFVLFFSWAPINKCVFKIHDFPKLLLNSYQKLVGKGLCYISGFVPCHKFHVRGHLEYNV